MFKAPYKGTETFNSYKCPQLITFKTELKAGN